ncbi:sugar phosphate isomerase/epimerase family protein [Bryobacter aggregatus]|uniref:sugar phosphate isomerase/epimerase family protein n=1 Tax=Bryobacter aggregatus TaxID=360054 RepID=UPI001EE1BA64|nr:sugar phosphate isomerase/epimerase [Bryobacter aggregatus]
MAASATALSAAPNSKIQGVQLGVITYSFRGSNDLDEIIKNISDIGLSEVELMANHAESVAGAPMPAPRPPQGPRPSGPPTPEQLAAMRARMNGPEAQKAREDLRKWRLSASMSAFQPVKKKFSDAGIDLRLLCFNMNESFTDDEFEYMFQVAKTLGVKAITTSTQLTVAKRVAPFADKHKILVGYHGHDNVKDPNEFSTLETFETAMSYSKYNGLNLDIGHFVAANSDPIALIRKHHQRITNLHLKDRKKDHGPNTVWGEGDTPIGAVLQVMKKEKYPFPANIEYEYRGQGTPAEEVAKCFDFCKKALA